MTEGFFLNFKHHGSHGNKYPKTQCLFFEIFCLCVFFLFLPVFAFAFVAFFPLFCLFLPVTFLAFFVFFAFWGLFWLFLASFFAFLLFIVSLCLSLTQENVFITHQERGGSLIFSAARCGFR